MWTTGVTLVTVVVLSLVGMTETSTVDRDEADRLRREKRSESEEARWTRWFNSDRPWLGEGDFETTNSIQKTQRICDYDEEVMAAQCRVSGTNDTFDATTSAFEDDHLLQACSSHGLICLNAQQPSGKCSDYEVRFLCQGTQDGTSSLFPNFDFRVYIVLAVVPLFVVTLRVAWACCCKQRMKRRQLRQARLRQRESVTSSSLTTSPSQASMDSSLASPPPAYSELFGDGQLNVFSISGAECVGCAKCRDDAAHVTRFQGVSLVSSGVEQSVDDVFVSPATTTTATATAPTTSPDPATTTTTSSGCDVPSSPTTQPQSESTTTATTATQSDQPSTTTTAVPEGNSTTTTTTTRPSLPSNGSATGAAAPPLTLSPSPLPSTPLTTTPPCQCACHRRESVGGQVNVAFYWEADPRADPVHVTTVHPGMHRPVLAFSRIGSESSFASLPDYEEALEILKKSGLLLEGGQKAV